MPEVSRGVKVVVPLFVVAIMAAFLLPVVMSNMSGVETATYNQTVGETVELQPGLNATLDSTDTTADSATYTVAANGDTATATVNNGSNQTVTVDGADVTIGVEEVRSGSATATYEYPTTYGWGAAGSLWTVIPIMLVLAIFLYVTYMAVGDRL